MLIIRSKSFSMNLLCLFHVTSWDGGWKGRSKGFVLNRGDKLDVYFGLSLKVWVYFTESKAKEPWSRFYKWQHFNIRTFRFNLRNSSWHDVLFFFFSEEWCGAALRTGICEPLGGSIITTTASPKAQPSLLFCVAVPETLNLKKMFSFIVFLFVRNLKRTTKRITGKLSCSLKIAH